VNLNSLYFQVCNVKQKKASSERKEAPRSRVCHPFLYPGPMTISPALLARPTDENLFPCKAVVVNVNPVLMAKKFASRVRRSARENTVGLAEGPSILPSARGRELQASTTLQSAAGNGRGCAIDIQTYSAELQPIARHC
jgi:hypothetical protein